jgi:hypothetical protein
MLNAMLHCARPVMSPVARLVAAPRSCLPAMDGIHSSQISIDLSGRGQSVSGGADHTPSEIAVAVAQSPSHGRVFTALSVTSGPLPPLLRHG